jgi:hypothetical protein
MTLVKRPFRQRVVALAAAYAIALAGLIASFDTAQAVADATAQPDVVICHNSPADEPAPGPQDSNGNLCIKSCVGCITSLAMAIPPTPRSALATAAAVTARTTRSAKIGSRREIFEKQ